MSIDLDDFMRWAFVIQLMGINGIARPILCGFIQMRGKAEGRKWKEPLTYVIGGGVCAIALFYLMAVYVFFPESLPWMYIGLPDFIRWMGFAASLAVSGFLSWVFMTIGTAGSKQLITFDAMKLATTGPYSRIRHPMYTGMFLHGITFLLFTDHWGAGGAHIGLLLSVAIFRVPHEEKVLLEHFGDEYRQYMERTSRFLPF